MTLPVDEFLRRFLLHIVPARFMRVRHFGLLANRRRATALAQCRQILAAPAPVPPAAAPDRPTADEPSAHRCPFCQVGHWVRVEIRPHHIRRPPACDSS